MGGSCPRCGLPGYRSVEKRGGRHYVYYVHYTPKTKKVRKCYVGPAARYEYVEHMHSLDLDNLESVDYFAVAMNALKNYVRRVEKEAEERPQLKGELLSKVERLIAVLERLREELLEEEE
ncbi:MAG: hypothetical protein QXG57_08820 [Thermofilaceae archaeon]